MRIAIVAILVFCATTLFAQDTCSWHIEGHVIDDHNKEPLGFALISIPALNLSVVSNAEGHYAIGGLCSGTYIVYCRHLSCEELIDTLIVEGNVHHDFYPEHHTEVLDAIHLVDQHRSDHTELHLEDKVEVIDRPLAEQLEKLSGVYTMKTGGQVVKPVIDGLHSNRLVILNNGVKQEGQQWGTDHAPAIDPFANQKTEVIKGASSVIYGPEAIGGVVKTEMGHIATEKPLETQLFLGAGSNARQMHVALQNQGSLKRIHGMKWRSTFSFLRSGNIKTPDYYLANTGSVLKNGMVQFQYHHDQWQWELIYGLYQNKSGIFSGSHIGNLTDLLQAIEADEPLVKADFTYKIEGPYQQVLHEFTKLKSSYVMEDSKIEIDYSRQFNRRKEYDVHDLDQADIDLNLTTHAVDAIWLKPGKERISVKTGIHLDYQTNTSGARPFIPNYEKQGAGIFGVLGLRKDFWKWELGLRQDIMSQSVYVREANGLKNYRYSYAQTSASFSALYKKNDWWWQQTLSTGWRPPQVNELFANGVHHGAASYEIGDGNLIEEKALSYRSEWDYVRDRMHLKVEIWGNYIRDFIFLEPQDEPTLTIRGAFPTFQYRQTDALLYGLNLQGDYPMTDFLTYYFGLNITRARNLDANDFLVMIPPDNMKQRLQLNFRDGANMKNTYLALELQYVSQQWRVPPQSDYAAPPNGYALMNLRLGTNLLWKEYHFRCNLSVDNLFDKPYRDYMNRLRYYADEMGRNVRLSIIINI